MNDKIEKEYADFLLKSTIKFVQKMKLPKEVADRTFTNLNKFLIDNSRYEDIEVLKKISENYENNNKKNKEQ